MASSPYWKLRRLAARALRVLARNKGEHNVILAYEDTLKTNAEAFISAYDAAATYEITARAEMKEGKAAITALASTAQSWMPLVQRDVPSFAAAEVNLKGGVPDDIIQNADQLHDIVTDYKDASDKALPYQTTCLKALDDALKKAIAQWTEAEKADTNYQELLSATRKMGSIFDEDLMAFRRTLASVLGRSDNDYQKLRAKRVHLDDDDDDASAPAVPSAVSSAAPGTAAPTPGGGAGS